MIENNIGELFKLASVFRRAIMKCEPKSLSVTLQDFPLGAYGDTTSLLAKYLENNKCGYFQYVLGNRNSYSHAWLQQGNIIVDITADQFYNQNIPVIVTRDHYWHSFFYGAIKHIADFEMYDDSTVSILQNDYKTIVEHIK